MPKGHYSSCSLHDLHAEFPMPCNCGGFKDDTQCAKWWNHSDYSPVVAMRNFYLLWQARIFWKYENHASLLEFLLEVARHSRLAHWFGYSQASAAQQHADDSCNKN